jgi:hypothetical protein
MDVESTVPNFDEAEIRPAVIDLLASAGLSGEFSLNPISGGRNNRVFRLQTRGRRLLLKWYFFHPRDKRDRLQTEFSFCQFLWSRGLRNLPQPIACLNEKQIALYGYIEGRQLSADEIGQRHIDAALDFYHAINRHHADQDAVDLPDASEACFRIEDHLDCVRQRLTRLEQIDWQTESHCAAGDFVINNLLPLSLVVLERAKKQSLEWEMEINAELEGDQRCLSPSDFGFHNALLDGNNNVFFVDFEYAGWDDPAKLICDFFCQPASSAPLEFLPEFSESVLASLSPQGCPNRRVQLLLPVYQLKWCCILLNEFLPTGAARREFGRGVVDQDVLESQIEKARQLALNASSPMTEANWPN